VNLRGLAELTWLEIKIFLREPLGAIGTVVLPVIAFLVLGRLTRRVPTTMPTSATGVLREGGVAAFVALLISVSAVLSLVTIISIYREGGILKRLRATPLRPYTILGAHVLVKLLLTATTMTLLMLAGKRYVAASAGVPMLGFALALLLSVASVLSIGFVIASVVPTARFAQPIGALFLYPMVGISGIFVPVSELPPVMQRVARALPFTYVVSLLQGIWRGEPWSAHLTDLGALALTAVVCVAISSRVFRWE
jgi:ABC-2 type transport system permease protein